MSKIQQPVQSIKLTNVSIVRYKSHGSRFELACYKNRVNDWREGREKQIEEVLQSHFIFYNVSKGITAKNEDLLRVFKTTDFRTIAETILSKGEYQQGDKERALSLEQRGRDIAQIIADKCVNRETQKPFSVSVIERAMKDLHYSIKSTRTPKQQALDLIKQLQRLIPIQRARMRIKIITNEAIYQNIKTDIQPLLSQIESEQHEPAVSSSSSSSSSASSSAPPSSEVLLIALIDPGKYKEIEEIIANTNQTSASLGSLSMEILDLKVHDVSAADSPATSASASEAPPQRKGEEGADRVEEEEEQEEEEEEEEIHDKRKPGQSSVSSSSAPDTNSALSLSSLPSALSSVSISSERGESVGTVEGGRKAGKSSQTPVRGAAPKSKVKSKGRHKHDSDDDDDERIIIPNQSQIDREEMEEKERELALAEAQRDEDEQEDNQAGGKKKKKSRQKGRG